MSRVILNGVSKAFESTVVVPGIDLEAREGEFLSLLGPSGCGKTTVLRMIAGLETPSGGTIRLGDEVVFDAGARTDVPPEKRCVGMVFQSYAVWPHLTVFENVAFPLRCRKVPRQEIEGRVMEMLGRVQLADYAKRRPHQLSGGQQQRVSLARALVGRPRVLLLDEPLSNLDAALRDELCDELIALRRLYPVTMIYVTHDQREAAKLSDRIALMKAGRLERLGSPSEVLGPPRGT